MIDWQLTATTVYCTKIEGEVTIFVYKDGGVNCTGFGRQRENTVETHNRAICTELMCQQVTGYRDRLFAEEVAENG